jgi:hypothetical protein
MSDNAVCTNCGARAPELGARFCSFCGHELPRPAPAPLEPPPADPAAGFRRLRRHPDFARLQTLVPAVGPQRVGAVGAVIFGVAFLSAGLVMIVPAMAFPPMAVPIVALLAFGLFFVVASARRAARLTRGALARVPARIADERTAVSGGGDSQVQTRYFVSLESEHGTREEYEVDASVASKVAPGDVGVAYFKGGILVDFQRPGA